jgi:SRSO17 transposase
VAIEEREPVWLVMEWRSDDDSTPKFYLTTLPRRMSHKQLVRILKERWGTERMYEDLKGELGLDHFEGRSFVGWHHHVSVVLCCYAFVVAEQMRVFPPSCRRQGVDDSLQDAA